MIMPHSRVLLCMNVDTPHGEKHSTGGQYLRSAVFGGMDGMMTTFSVVTGVVGVLLITYARRAWGQKLCWHWE